MKKIIADGWHEIAGYSVYVEGGCVKMGTKDHGQLPAYPYRAANGGWDLDQSMSVDTFRRKVKDGSATMR